jgi:hypothetical protein
MMMDKKQAVHLREAITPFMHVLPVVLHGLPCGKICPGM